MPDCTQYSARVSTIAKQHPVIVSSNYFYEFAMIECPKCGATVKGEHSKVPESKSWTYGYHSVPKRESAES